VALEGDPEDRQNYIKGALVTTTLDTTTTESKSGLRWSHVLWIILATILLTVGATYWAVRTYIYAKDFKPVVLKQKEVAALDKKLKQLGISTATEQSSVNKNPSMQSKEFNKDGSLFPEKYTESGAKREVSFTERELNALLAYECKASGTRGSGLSSAGRKNTSGDGWTGSCLSK
jgi:hypothetical protein